MSLSSNFSRQAPAVIVLTLTMAGLWWFASPRLLHMAARAVLESRARAAQSTAPDFNLKDAKGHAVRLSDYRGRVVLLNFWATWCGPCQIEIPWFVEFENKYGAQGFTVLGISMDEDGWNAVKRFLAAKDVNYQVVLSNEEVNQLYGGIESLPTTLLIGRDGRTEFFHSGLIGQGEYQTEIRQLLGAKQDEARIDQRPVRPASEPHFLTMNVLK